MGETPIRAAGVEEALNGGADPATAAARADEGVSPPSDSFGSAEYRRELAKVLVRRASRRRWRLTGSRDVVTVSRRPHAGKREGHASRLAHRRPRAGDDCHRRRHAGRRGRAPPGVRRARERELRRRDHRHGVLRTDHSGADGAPDGRPGARGALAAAADRRRPHPPGQHRLGGDRDRRETPRTRLTPSSLDSRTTSRPRRSRRRPSFRARGRVWFVSCRGRGARRRRRRGSTVSFVGQP